MITIFHGDNVSESREKYIEERSNLANSKIVEGKGILRDDLLDFFQGSNMFFENKNLAIENLLSKNKPSKALNEIIEILNSNNKNSNILLWEEKEIGKKILDQLNSPTIQTFKIPKLIFTFLDSIKPHGGKNLVALFHKILDESPIEIIIFMLIRQLRILLALKSNKNSIDEVIRLASWQKGKLEKQSGYFSKEILMNLYKKLYEIDLSQKTGKLNTPITSAIDIFLISI